MRGAAGAPRESTPSGPQPFKPGGVLHHPLAARLTLGLCNTYDAGMWHDVMRVNLARAGPVALAFGCDLATFGFPYAQARERGSTGKRPLGLRTPLDVARFVAQGTTIGEEGAHLLELAEAGRFHLCDMPTQGGDPARGWPARFGRAVLTTPSPDPAKLVTPRQVAEALAAGSSQLLVLGLGPRGLPAGLLESASVHLEMTGRRVSLDTATAMGALPALVAAHLEHLQPAATGGTAR